MHFKIPENNKLISRYTVFVIYDDKSHYPSNHKGKKTVICEENIFQLNLVRRFKKRSNLLHLDHIFDLIYCQWNTTEPDVVCTISFLMFSL